MLELQSNKRNDIESRLIQLLMNQRNENGHWTGELSTSALSTATAVMALLLVPQTLMVSPKDDGHTAASDRIAEGRLRELVQGGLSWLAAHQNADGGWGDTTLSVSNISTTMLVHAVFVAVRRSELKGETPTEGIPTTSTTRYTQESDRAAIISRAESYIRDAGGVAALLRRYGKDHTFSVPILTHCALAGTVDWKHVIPLPFELSCIPAKFYAAVRMPVVSYALPALIAIGQVIFHHQGHRNPLIRWIRRHSISRSLRVLESIQPENGGFLEATPLTSFVCMSLLGCGLFDHPVTKKCLRFIEQSVRADGSWPIDTNLTTWVTTLSINALSPVDTVLPGSAVSPMNALPRGRPSAERLSSTERQTLREWLLKQQYRSRHPYTNAAPGGWSWTNLPGGVPDADDTPGAMLALMNLRVPGEEFSQEEFKALEAAAGWLLDLQNRDGGWPTFCRGWGTLPFDRSSCDLTAHSIRALRGWLQMLADSRADSESGQHVRAHRAIMKGYRFLEKTQRTDGTWLPLWFGHQHNENDENPLYGTSRVVLAWAGPDHLSDTSSMDTDSPESDASAPSSAMMVRAPAVVRAIEWMLKNQNSDGGWSARKGLNSSSEETGLALESLAQREFLPIPGVQEACERAFGWIEASVQAGTIQNPSPIGFYFAKLWYFERLYPIIFPVSGALKWLALLSSERRGAKNDH